MESSSVLIWLGFAAFVAAMLAIDLGLFRRKSHVPRLPEALTWSAIWFVLALAFTVWVFLLYSETWSDWPAAQSLTGRRAALQFFVGYVVEKCLSINYVFVVAMIFTYFRVPLVQQQRLLVWGVLGAVGLRGVLIATGAGLIARFDWIAYLLGLTLLWSAARLLKTRHDTISPDRNFLVRLVRRRFPVGADFAGDRFFSHTDGRVVATPLLLALLMVQSANFRFAIDAIPAIFAITNDTFIVFTSNVFAMLGLRSLYFALAGLMDRFRYLKTSLVFVLAYVGVKMILVNEHPIPNLVSLGVIGGMLGVGLLASARAGHADTAALISPIFDELEELAEVSVRQARRIVILVVGSTVALLGVVMIVLPGPAILVIPFGLSILAIEFAWARRWLANLRKAAGDLGDYVSRRFRKKG